MLCLCCVAWSCCVALCAISCIRTLLSHYTHISCIRTQIWSAHPRPPLPACSAWRRGEGSGPRQGQGSRPRRGQVSRRGRARAGEQRGGPTQRLPLGERRSLRRSMLTPLPLGAPSRRRRPRVGTPRQNTTTKQNARTHTVKFRQKMQVVRQA